MLDKKFQGIHSLIGNTPLLEIFFRYKGDERRLYAKAENLNMTGSIKDRMVYHIISKAYKKGILKPHAPVVEATSGNTGISVAAIARALGHPVTIFMPDWMSSERKNLIKSLGAEIILVSKKEGGFLGSIDKAVKLAKKLENAFLPSQFSNEDNAEAHYQTTAPELWWQLDSIGLTPDAFIAGVGTGGTIMGVGKFLCEKNPKIKKFPLEPQNSPTLSTGYKVGQHRIQGISDEFIPSIVKLDQLDEVVQVDDGDAIIMAQKLAQTLGLGVGISSGANFIGALIKQNEMGHDKIVTTVFPDSNKKYLSTDLLKKETVKDGFHSPDIELVYFRAINRVCKTCTDYNECLDTEFSYI